GRSHRELLVTGPGSTRVALMEAAADSGEILLSPETAELLRQPESIGGVKEPGFLLKRSPRVSDFQPPGSPPFAGDVSEFVPLAIREVVLGGINEGEHRIVTVGFIHFGRVDEGLTSGRIEEITEGLEKLVSYVQAIVHEEDIAFLASDIYPDGGKLILTAGAPLSSGNDEERMLRTLTRIKENRHDFPLRIGVYRGRVFSGEIGSPFRKTYTVMGDAVNMAARLMQKAQEGELLTTDELLDKSRTKFHVTALESFLPKGKSEQVTPFDVGKQVTSQLQQTQHDNPLIGREKELAHLQSLLAAGNKSPVVIEVAGGAGIGKSRLIHEVLTRSELPFLALSCEQYQESTPYWVVGRMLAELLELDPSQSAPERGQHLEDAVGKIAPDLLSWMPLVASIVEAEFPPTPQVRELKEAFRRERLHSTVVSLVDHLMPAGILSVDDAHWMDSGSSQLLNILAGSGSRSLLLGRRYEDRGFQPSEEAPPTALKLEPLPIDACERLARHLDGTRSFRQQDLKRIAERSGGNPIFLMELVQSARESGRSDALPTSIEAVISSRIDRLTSRDRRVLRYASVLGPSFDPILMQDAKIEFDEGVWSRLGDFVQIGPQSRVSFISDLYRQTAYEGLSYKTRRTLHSEIGDLLRGRKGAERRPEILSTHFHAAQRHAESWHFSRIAGQRALSNWSLVEAATFLERALEAAHHVDRKSSEVMSTWEDLALCFGLTGRYEDAQKALLVARKHIEDPVEGVRLISKLGEFSRMSGNHSKAVRWYNRGLRILENFRSQEAARVKVRLLLGKAIVDQERGRLAQSLDTLHLAERIAQAEGDEPGLGHIYHFLHINYMKMGDPRSLEYRGRAIPIFRKVKDQVQLGHALNAVGSDYYYNGEWNKARVYYEKSRKVRERAGDVLGQALSANNTAEILSDQGFLDEAQALFEEALSIWIPARFEIGVAFAIGNVGRLLTRAGDLESGLEKLDEAVGRFERLGARAYVAEIKVRTAENRTLARGFHEAGELIEELMPSALEPGREAARMKAMILRLRSARYSCDGLLEAAYDDLSTSIEAARRWNIRFELAQSLKERARVARLRGVDPSSDDAEASRWFAKLGVINSVELPTPAPPPGV
ncbi:MAG TPA: AAA family ATPase, partial [Actinomycetota bacterium]|nr:AAA family ATPase [Actinomycetota bacterium]